MPPRLALTDAIDRAVSHVRRIDAELCARHDPGFPHITKNGTWQTTADGVWTGGFWAGLWWLVYERSRERAALERAMAVTDLLLPRSHDSQNHDLGFMFFPSAVKGWQLTGEARYRASAIAAAHSLGRQFNTAGGFIPGWGFFGDADWTGSVLIDTLMNLPLLVWAVRQGADPALDEVVRRHVATSLGCQLRPDGSVFHMFRFDPTTGAPLGGDTYQGLGADSAWARGQAWAITGLAILARMTGEANYREASERVAAYFSSQLTQGLVPPWDFAAGGPDEPRDSSASAIASYGFQKLYELGHDPCHLETAVGLLAALAATCANHTDSGGLLLHATADLPHGLGIDESTMYGDYYYLKALMALERVPPEALRLVRVDL
jgi:unsaturated chondroitin disaccharide hydrolase